MILQKVAIKKLWGSKDLSFQLNQDVTFLIGNNGSGKTTVISLIAAILRSDLNALERIPFKSAQLQIGDPEKPNRKILLEVQELENPTLFGRISFKITDGKETFSTSELGHIYWETNGPHRNPMHHVSDRAGIELRSRIEKYIKVSWLNLTRSVTKGPEGSKNDLIDQKLLALSQELAKYFSEIDSEISVQRDRFQKAVFLKLIQRKTEPQLIEWLKDIDLPAEQKAVKEILRSFSVLPSQWEGGFDSHFGTLRNLLKKNPARMGYSFEELEALIAMQHLHAVVQDWHELVKKQKKITENRVAFSQILADLMPSKNFEINSKNELEVYMKSDARKIGLRYLSSGEKQMLILIGEALLQRGGQHVYIADEPELSLHVKWQEKIVALLLALNPRAQILFATHSPDIVGDFERNVIDMETLISGPHSK